MDNLFECKAKANQVFLAKLRLEMKSLYILTNKILAEVGGGNRHEVIKTNPAMPKLDIPNRFKITDIEDLYENVKKFLMALIQYLNSREELRVHFTLPTTISGPTLFHLPTLGNMLWRRIEVMNKRSQNKNHVSKRDLIQTAVSMSSQTEISTLMHCQSCHVSTELIKSLVYFVLEQQKIYNVKQTKVSNFRQRIKNEVFDMSQWGVMKGWTAAIQEDIEWLLSLTVSTLRKCDRLYKDIETMKREYTRSGTALQNDLDLTKSQLEAEQSQSKYLQQQVENLNSSLSRRIKQEGLLMKNIHEYQEKFKYLSESLKFIKDDCKQMRVSQKSLQRFVRTIILSKSRNISDVKNEIIFNMKKLEDYFIQKLQEEKIKFIEIQTISEDRKNFISTLQTNILELHNDKEQLIENVKDLIEQKNKREDEIKKIKDKVMELEKLFEESKARESQVTHSIDDNLKISGDPVTDMENQRQINKQKIKALLRENANLKTTISKLKKMRTEPFESKSSVIAVHK